MTAPPRTYVPPARGDLPSLPGLPPTPEELARRERLGAIALAFIAGTSVGCAIVLHFVPIIWRLL